MPWAIVLDLFSTIWMEWREVRVLSHLAWNGFQPWGSGQGDEIRLYQPAFPTCADLLLEVLAIVRTEDTYAPHVSRALRTAEVAVALLHRL